MLYKFNTDRQSDVPIYLQLAEKLRGLIRSGALKSGAKFPSRRDLAKYLKLSKNTVSAAFAVLTQDGLVVSEPKSGFFVADAPEMLAPDWPQYIKRAKHKPGVSQYKYWANTGGLSELGLCSDFDMAPFIDGAYKTGLKRMSDPAYIDKHSKYGIEPLRESIAAHLKTMGILADTEEILICPGSIQILYPLYESLMTTGSNFIYEKSNLILTISNIHSIGMNMIPVPLDEHGISALELEKLLPKYKYPILHVDTTDHAPTGIVMSKKRREEIVDLVQKHRIPILEIDHFRDGWHTIPFPPPLKAMDSLGDVIYMGSFLRCHPFDFHIAWIVADRYIVEHLSDVLIQNGMKVNYLTQLAADEMFRSGKYYEMIEAARQFIRVRREIALSMCEKYLSGMGRWNTKHCGFHFWLEFPDANIRKIFKDAIYNDFYPGYFFDRSDNEHILLCPASIHGDTLEKAIRDIASLVQ